jgi:hypothetical protein
MIELGHEKLGKIPQLASWLGLKLESKIQQAEVSSEVYAHVDTYYGDD